MIDVVNEILWVNVMQNSEDEKGGREEEKMFGDTFYC